MQKCQLFFGGHKMFSRPMISEKWLGGDRIKIDRVSNKTRFRVFAGDFLQKNCTHRNSTRVYMSGIHNGPKSEKTVIIDDIDCAPPIEKILGTIDLLQKKFPKLWFYDQSNLNLKTEWDNKNKFVEDDLNELFYENDHD